VEKYREKLWHKIAVQSHMTEGKREWKNTVKSASPDQRRPRGGKQKRISQLCVCGEGREGKGRGPRRDTDTLVYTQRMESTVSVIVVNYMAAVLWAASMPGHIGRSTPCFCLITMLSTDKLKYICAYLPSQVNQRTTSGWF